MSSTPGQKMVNRQKRFVLIFDDLQSVHLFKDVGQIPYQLQRHFGYQVEIVCRRNEEQYQYVNDLLAGLRLTFYTGSVYRYLFEHAKTIDVLMLFHVSSKTIYRGLCYKLLNPVGQLYIKTDMNGERILYAAWGERNLLTQAKRAFLFNQLLRYVDLISFETELSFRGVSNVPASKKLLLPNGFDPDFIDRCGVRRRTFEEKENIILLVGRHGDYAKNSELMLDVLVEMGDLEGWQVWFVGPLTAKFEQQVVSFRKQYPQLSERVLCTGQIDDKQELFELYNRAKLLCLTSRWESWGMVCVEAMAFGCVLVMAPVSSAADLTDNGRCGLLVPDYKPATWAVMLQQLMSGSEQIQQLSLLSLSHFTDRFDWKSILCRLDVKLRESDELEN